MVEHVLKTYYAEKSHLQKCPFTAQTGFTDFQTPATVLCKCLAISIQVHKLIINLLLLGSNSKPQIKQLAQNQDNSAKFAFPVFSFGTGLCLGMILGENEFQLFLQLAKIWRILTSQELLQTANMICKFHNPLSTKIQERFQIPKLQLFVETHYSVGF